MKNILVIYYSQTGQTREILDSILTDVKQGADITYTEIKPVTPFPFPWKASSFFDAMPESVQRNPIPIVPVNEEILNKDYDLVIFGWQPWFLHPSQPTTGFLKSEQAKFLKGKNVLTVIGCRNMWLNAQEEIKKDLINVGAKLVGNIVLYDNNPNLISLLTVIRWSFKGQKERSRFLPSAGVQQKDIIAAKRFGKTILNALQTNNISGLQPSLMMQHAVELNTGLVLLEKRGIKNFRYWAKYIKEKGGPGNPERAKRVKQFQNLLLTAIFVLSPLSSFTAFIKRQLQRKSLLNDVKYFKGLGFEEGKI